MPSRSPSTQQLTRLMKQTDFCGNSQGTQNLYPMSANCTAVAAGVARALPRKNTSVVSVYSVDDGLIHSAVLYRGVLVDASGEVNPDTNGKEAFVPYFEKCCGELNGDLMEMYGYVSLSVEEFIVKEFVTEYPTLSEVGYDAEVADKAEKRFQETLEEEL